MAKNGFGLPATILLLVSAGTAAAQTARPAMSGQAMPSQAMPSQAMVVSGVENAWRDKHDTAALTRGLDLCIDQLHAAPSMRRAFGLRRCIAYETAYDQVAVRLGGPATGTIHNNMTILIDASLTQLGIAPNARPALEANVAARSHAALDTIVAVEAAPKRRYATADGLQDVLLATLPDGRVHATLETAAAQCGGAASGFLEQAGGGLRMTRADEGDACRLDIAERGGGLSVTERDCAALHGAGCDFNGSYAPKP